jgi:MYXO-CTERM domain-containing protein
MIRSILATLAISCASLLVATAALANEGDIQACNGKNEGDECTRSAGDAGTCQPDASDPAVLTCDDTGADDTGADDEACTGKAEGEACTRDDGSVGTCEPDDSDPGHLDCEDSASSGSGSAKCSITSAGAAEGASWTAALALGLAAAARRARRRR